MTQKAISLSTAAAILVAYLWSQLQPGAALFLLLPANLAINIGLVILAAVLVRLSFISQFKTQAGYLLTAAGAVICLVVGGFGLLSAGFNYGFLNWFGPLDYLLLTQAGIIFALSALSYEHQPVKLSAFKLSMPKVAFSQPRIALHSLRNLASAK